MMEVAKYERFPQMVTFWNLTRVRGEVQHSTVTHLRVRQCSTHIIDHIKIYLASRYASSVYALEGPSYT